MQHAKRTPKLGRPAAHRDAMMSNLVTSLFRHGRITTTVARAKALRGVADGLIAKAREDTVHSRRLVARTVHDSDVLRRLFKELAPRFEGVGGGFTRVLKLGLRKGDGAQLALVSVGSPEIEAPEPKPKRATKKGEGKPKTRRGKARPKPEEEEE